MTGAPRAPVVVIGAGAVGVSVAAHLAANEVDVILCDRGHAAGKTTGKAAGLVFSQFHDPVDVRAMAYCLDYVDRLDREEDDFTFHRTGYLRVGTEAERPTFEREVRIYRECGVDARLVEPDEIDEIEPALVTDDLTVGSYCPDDGHVDPHTFTTTMLRRAERDGVDYRPNTTVTDIVLDGDAVVAVETERGTIDADHVVIAAGPWSKQVARLAGVTLPLKPYRVQAMVTTEVDFDVIPVYDAAMGAYFRSEGSGVLVGDGTEEFESDPETYDERPDLSFLETAGEVMERRLAAGDVGVVNGWAGLGSGTPDAFPLLGNPPVEPGANRQVDGLWVACGLQAHGVMRAPIAGTLVADAIVAGDDRVSIPEYDPNRFDDDPGDFPVRELMKLE